MDSERYIRGAFAVFNPHGEESRQAGNLIPFRFNPEALSRSLQIEQGQSPGTEDAQRQGGGTGAGGTATSVNDGPLKQTFSVLIRLDVRDRETGTLALDRDQSGQPLPSRSLKLGVLPEIAALEQLMYPAETKRADNPSHPVAKPPLRPVVLLVWGIDRVFPVRVVSMTINETLHNANLAPTRAEVEVGLEVVRDDATGHPATRAALSYMHGQRKTHAGEFYKTVSSQGTYVSSVGETQPKLELDAERLRGG